MASYTHYIGIDMGMDTFVVHVHGEKNTHAFSNTEEGFAEFAGRFGFLRESLSVVESTGGYERPLMLFMEKKGFAVHRVAPRKSRSFLDTLHARLKTDDFDARGLSLYAKERWGQVEAGNMFDEDEERFRQLMGRREELVEMLKSERQRAKSPGSRACTLEFSLEKAIEEKLEAVEKAIEEFVSSHKEVEKKLEILEDVDGIGKVTARSLLAFMPELGTCTGKRIASLAGVAPHPRDSGRTRQYRTTRGTGRRAVRRILFLAALGALRCLDGEFTAFATRLKGRGKKARVILTALSRKILVTANGRIRDAMLAAEAPSAM